MIENPPLVSVGIPTYNRPEGLLRTLECITRQTYKNLEIIISDNCSPGSDTKKVAHEYIEKDSRIKYFCQDKNMGPTFNIKYVLEQATGEYFMWAADDDEWNDLYIESLVKILDSYLNLSVACCQTAYKNSDTNMIFPFFIQGIPLNSLSPRSYLQRLKYAVKENYGDLFYGIFRKNCLMETDHVDFEYNDLIHVGIKAMINGDAYVSRDFYFIKHVTTEVFLWTYLCAKDKSHKSTNINIENMLKYYYNSRSKKISKIVMSIYSSSNWHLLFFKTASKIINNTKISFLYRLYIKSNLFIYLFRSNIWTIFNES